ncbi:helix-turn-helix domain-containing protein [Providencia rettgeri]|uniref:helix-turn-helix domain-containing protein n=1 Tax=Providencia manganoxydans TaxID=2923283 RepID=UPI0034DDA46B
MKEMDWHRADIVAALHKQGVSLSQLSIDAGLSPSTLRNALRAPYPRAEEIIAHAIGVTPQEIWPSRYASRKRNA